MEQKPLPIGIDNFEKLITRGYYFVDKTLLIKDLLDKKLLRNPADITIAGGEPTITKDFDKTN